MSSLFSTLRATSGTLLAYERGLEVTQNNISNASTPDYATQQVQFDSVAFQPASGLSGGLAGITTTDTSDKYANASVQNELSNLGTAEQLNSSLTSLQSIFDVSGQTGISGSLSSFFSSFSALSVNPNDSNARQTVLNTAAQVAQSFNQVASSLSQTSASLDSQVQTKVAAINSLASQIQGYNVERQRSGQANPNLDAKVHTALESLSEIANVTSSVASNGTTSVLLGGQTPLVLGTQQFQIQSGYTSGTTPASPSSSGTPDVAILDFNGTDITAQINNGQLNGLLQVRNTVLPSLRGDTTQAGSINQLAQSFADRVNNLLTSGQVSSGPPVQSGVALFTYNASDPTNVAQSLAVDSSVTTSQIATIDPGPPIVGNGIANGIANLAQGKTAADQISGLSYTAYFGQVAASIGSQVTTASSNQDLYTQSVAQATNLRTQLSGVSLDTEAVNLIQFQKAYDATAKLVTVLNDIAQSTLDMLTP